MSALDPRRRRGLLLTLACLIPLLGACSSTPEEGAESDPEYTPPGAASRSDDSIGKYLGDLSNSIDLWMEKTLLASTQKERNLQSLLGINIKERVRIRQREILAELETGPTRNRVIAAAALGFTEDPAVLSPLLATLDDRNEELVGNALLGLTLLASTDTPLEPIGKILRFSRNRETRGSAAWCIRTLVEKGGDGSGILDPVRAGLTDLEAPYVRSQCALTIAFLNDTASIPALNQLLYDPEPLVSRSGAKALTLLGKENDKAKGDCARALVKALVDGERELRLRIYPSLVELSGRDYGLDGEQWSTWVARLP